MAQLAPPLVDTSELLELAHKILLSTRGDDLVQKISRLKGCLEPGRINPVRSYDVPRTVAELSEEARQIENLIRSVEQTLADPQTSLGEGMRLANWSKQLEAYLHGIHFALRSRESFCASERKIA